MQANTKQVRKVLAAAIKAHKANGAWFGKWNIGSEGALGGWTDKISNTDLARRSVVYALEDSKASAVLATVQAEFAKLGYTNKVKTTRGGMYLRCIADIA